MTTATVDSVVADLERDGYAIVPGLLEADRVRTIRAELTDLLDRTPSGRNSFEGFRTRRLYALFGKTRAFDDLALHPLLLGVLETTLGPHFQLSAPTGIEIGPGEVAQTLHHDDGIYPLAPDHAEVVCNSMWALDDFTERNGATRIVPGSHCWRTRRPKPSTRSIVAEMPAGSVLFYLGRVWHGGGANRTDKPRLGVILEYVVSWLRAQENHLLAVPRPVAAQLPERLQELLGYNIHPPFLGYVDGRHPRRALLEQVGET